MQHVNMMEEIVLCIVGPNVLVLCIITMCVIQSVTIRAVTGIMEIAQNALMDVVLRC